MPCVDLDTLIEEQTGQPIAALFESEGEAGFRKREAECLRELCQGNPAVVATGGGTPCQPGLLEVMSAAGTVVHLSTELRTALDRVGANKGSRPLLAKPASEVEALYRQRAPVYRRAHISVSTEGKDPDLVASDIESALENQLANSRSKSVVALRERSYPIVTENGCLEKLGDAIAERLPKVKRLGLISDSNVMPLYGTSLRDSLIAKGFEVVTETIVAGEASKSLAVFGKTVDSMIEGGLDRSSAIVAVGGGVVGDLAGYVAASLYRGIAVVQVPTTLLAMTDSSIGGKTGINSEHGKNLLGAFWQPSLVWSDPQTLTTLPRRERQAAFGELVKYAMLDEAVWPAIELLAPQIASEQLQVGPELCALVERCANLKASIVSTDERESGLRATLNLGHTVGHAIESHAGYGVILHGEAVALGLLATCRVSHKLGFCDAGLEPKVAAVLDAAGLDTDLDTWLRSEVLSRMGVDKKRTGSSVRFIVLAELGDVRRHDLDLSKLTGLLCTD